MTIAELQKEVSEFEAAGAVSFEDRDKLIATLESLKTELAAIVDELSGVEDAPHSPEDVGTPVSGSPTGEPVELTSYEYREFWAEESGGLNANSAEWSFGNGATGFIGIPVQGEGWEVFEMWFHADTYPSTASIEVAVCDYMIAASSAAANVLSSISLADARDGFGYTNNATKVVRLDKPIALNEKALVGFRTLSLKGSVSDARVGVRIRRKA